MTDFNHERRRRQIGEATSNLDFYIRDNELWAVAYADLVSNIIRSTYESTGVAKETLTNMFLGKSGTANMTNGMLFDYFVVSHIEGDETSLKEYLRIRGWRESNIGKEYLRALSTAPLKLYEVVEVKPGETISVQPYGEAPKILTVTEKLASQDITKGHFIVTRVLTVKSDLMFSGSMIPLLFQQAAPIYSSLEVLRQQNQNLSAAEYETALFYKCFNSWAAHTINPEAAGYGSPANSNSEPYVVTRNYIPLKVDPDIVRRQLSEIFTPEGDRDWLWLENNSRLLASITLEKDKVVTVTNSVAGGQRVVELIQSQLGDSVGEAMGFIDSSTHLDMTNMTPTREVPTDPVEASIVSNFLNNHYRESLDKPIPMIENLTPREATRIPGKRQLAVKWIRTVESSAPPGSLEWIWDELELTGYKNIDPDQVTPKKTQEKKIPDTHPTRHIRRLQKMYPHVWDALPEYRDGADISWPGWSFLPEEDWWDIVSDYVDEPNPQKVAELALIGTWRLSQGIYQFEPALYESLAKVELSKDIPASVLYRLPEWGVYVKTPAWKLDDGERVNGFFSCLWSYDVFDDENDVHASLLIALDTDLGLMPFELAIGDWTVLEGFERSMGEDKSLGKLVHMMTGPISMILYLCSDEPDVEGRVPGISYASPKKTKKGVRWFEGKPRVHHVGREITKRLSAEYAAQNKTEQGQKKAHLRKGHFHGFWKGPRGGDRQFFYKWIDPILVKGKAPVGD